MLSVRPSVRPSVRSSAAPRRAPPAPRYPLQSLRCRCCIRARGSAPSARTALSSLLSLSLSQTAAGSVRGCCCEEIFSSLSLSLFFFCFCFVIFNTSWCLSSGLSRAKCRATREVHRGKEEGEETEDKKKKKSNQSRYIATKITTIIKKKGGEREKKKTTTNKPSTPQLRQEDEKYFKAFIQQESLKALQSFIALLTSPSKWQMDTAAGPMGGSLPANISIEQGNFWELSIRAPSADCQLGAP